MAGTTGQTVAYLLDVVRRRMQMCLRTVVAHSEFRVRVPTLITSKVGPLC